MWFPTKLSQDDASVKGSFISPSENDDRSPCPGLNTLANHGYINRNGQNISDEQIRESFLTVYGISNETSNLLLSAAKDLKNDKGNLDLNRLREHNVLEHDASLVHSDSFFGLAWVVNQSLVNSI
jgi:hypothetical protein